MYYVILSIIPWFILLLVNLKIKPVQETEQVTQTKYAFLKSIWFWWIIITAAYLCLGILFKIPSSSPSPSFIGYVTSFIGLFVPFGFASLAISLMIFPSIIFFIGAMIITDTRIINKSNIPIAKAIMMCFLALLLITICVDFIRLTPFESWKILLQGGYLKVNTSL